jgi:tryptophan 2,3-dioxygenase
MPSSYEATFIERLAGMDNESLLRTLVQVTAAPGGYRPEALAAVKDEVARRGLGAARQREAASRLQQEGLDALQDDAERLALEGQSVSAIEAHLKARGLDDGTVAAIAKRASDVPAEKRKRAGRRNMMSGAALFTLGITITAVSYYVAATSPEGGRYAIAWGLVVVGIGQFLRGWAQSTDSSQRVSR